MRTFAIKNFESFQHYKERKPPWVKLYRELWRDRDFFRLPEASKLLFLGLTTIASVTDNRIPDDPEWLALELGLSVKSIDLKPLVSAGFLFLVQDASNMLADCKQLAIVETETDQRQNTEKEKDISAVLDSPATAEPPSPPAKPSAEWADEDKWLKHFLEAEQRTFNGHHLPALVDPEYWDQLSIATNGIDKPFVSKEFAKMGIWLKNNPRRGPTPRGTRQFVAHWMQKAAEQERRRA